MAKNRYVNTAKWDDEWHRSIGIVGRGLFDYLMTNSLTNIAGIYSITLARMAFDTGIDESELKKLLFKFEADGKIIFAVSGGSSWVVMVNWLKHQTLGTKTAIAVVNHINNLPSPLRRKIMDKASVYGDNLENSLCKPFKYKIDTVSYTMDTASHSNSNSNPNSNINSNAAGAASGGDQRIDLLRKQAKELAKRKQA